MSVSATAAPATATRPRTASPLRGLLLGGGLAVVLDVAALLVANAVLAGSVQVTQAGQSTPSDLPVVLVVLAAVVSAALGAGVLWLLDRFTSSGLRLWTWVAAVVTVLSVVAPLTLPVDAGSKWALAVLHVLTGAAVILGQRRAAAVQG